ncbi:MAG: hypothetical protein Q8755_03220, partial [Candidatus Phytoplasma australasiaticum]|nr:hypothetical protein [Candidatus Phytoplasma australasiaticum]
MGADKTRAMNEQVEELLKAGIIREIRYQTWVANPVMVQKSNGTWRMCIDFKDLNKACPKDCYPLPKIDLKVDSLAPLGSSAFWTRTKAITRSRWLAKINIKLPSAQRTTYTVTQRCRSCHTLKFPLRGLPFVAGYRIDATLNQVLQ